MAEEELAAESHRQLCELVERTSLDRPRVVVLPACTPSDIREFHDGVLFVHSRWNGASFQSFSRLAQLLDERPYGRLRVLLADNDFSETVFEELFRIPSLNGILRHSMGVGEAARVIGGKARVGIIPLAVGVASALGNESRELWRDFLDPTRVAGDTRD